MKKPKKNPKFEQKREPLNQKNLKKKQSTFICYDELPLIYSFT